jgi:hypothetical protein
MQDNQEALLITYASGGSTPGDSYMWFRPPYRPKACACGLVLFLGGLETTWEKLKTFKTIKIATSHKGLIDLKLEDVEETINRKLIMG